MALHQEEQNLPVTVASGFLGAGIETCSTADGLVAFNDPGMELIIWRRALPMRLRSWLEELDASRIPHLRVLVKPKDLRRVLEPHLEECHMPPGDLRDLLVGDIDNLVAAFARITRSDFVDVRLERISHDSCWKFHRDNVQARLLTTYRGPATEWIQPKYAERALCEQRDFGGPIEAMQNHDVAIFKGRAAGSDSGIVHRSPPIEGSGQTRLLLCLNRRSEVSPAPQMAKQEIEAS